MQLSESYDVVKRSIVGFVPRYIPLHSEDQRPPVFPPIFGTGFVAKAEGLTATNDHVVKAIGKLFRPPEAPADEWPFLAMAFRLTDRGMIQVPLDVLGVFRIGQFTPGPIYYGPRIPDIAFVRVKAKGLPALTVDDSTVLEEGLEVATAGFPMGTDALMAPGWLHQVTPTLQTGIISALLPFACASPHAFMINVMTQSGASGSPVFLPETGGVIGALYAGLRDVALTQRKDVYKVPTNISYVVPAHFITSSLRNIEGDPNFKLPEDARTIEEMIETEPIKSVLEETRQDRLKAVQPVFEVQRNVERVDLANASGGEDSQQADPKGPPSA